MWKVESGCVTLKVAPKLTRSHIFPNGFEKMWVDLAFQVFSAPVRNALAFYKEQIESKYPNSDPTRIVIGLMANLIEAMTSRFPAEALRCLSFYSLARSPKGGNVPDGVVESLLSVEELLNETDSEEQKAESRPLRSDAAEVSVDHASYISEQSDARLIYYIAGYMARKRVLSIDCEYCKAACLMKKEDVPSSDLPTEASMQ
ncbi:uncharacterized protein LOC144105343 [Amblyomma americanum]